MQRKLLGHLFTVVLLATSLLGTMGSPAAALCTIPGAPALDFSLQNLDGGEVSLTDYEGKVVMMVFWSSWCSRCREEMEFLQALAPRLAEDVVVLAINQETENADPEQRARLREEVASMGLEFPVLLDTELDVWGQYCVNALPTSIIVDRDGEIAFAEPNYYWASQDQLTAALRDLDALHD